MSRILARQKKWEWLRSAPNTSVNVTFSADSTLYRLSCVCLLAIAAFLRLYELPAEILSHDEAVTVQIAEGSVLEIIKDTGARSSSPILYPLLLKVLLKVDASPLTVRLLPAVASILTIAALLLWLPRVGVAPAAALLSGLMATLCGELIRHAQDVREYSLDTLVATLMLIGLLKYLRGGGRALLCATLGIAPLVQYGLVLLGAAMLATLALSTRDTPSTPCPAQRPRRSERLRHLAAPAGCFALALGATYVLTLRTHGLNAVASGRFGPNVQPLVYRGDLTDLDAMIRFVAETISAFADHYAPMVVTVAGGIALTAMLACSMLKRQMPAPVHLLFLFAGAAAMAAALLSLYPLGPDRWCMYLAPVFFVGLAHALHSVLNRLPASPRQALTAVVAAVAAIEGGVEVAADFPYQERGHAKTILAALDEHVGDDPAYLPRISVPIMDYYYPERSDQFFRGDSCRWRENEACEQDFVTELLDMHRAGAQRVWVVFFSYRDWNIVRQWRDEGLARHVVDTGFFNLFLIPYVRSVVVPESLFETVSKLTPRDGATFIQGLIDGSRQVVEHAHFDVYVHEWERALIYVADAAAPAEEMRVLLHVAPVEEASLPAERRGRGFAWLNFNFRGDIRLDGGRRAQVVLLPKYRIRWITIGRMDGGAQLWRQGFKLEKG